MIQRRFTDSGISGEIRRTFLLRQQQDYLLRTFAVRMTRSSRHPSFYSLFAKLISIIPFFHKFESKTVGMKKRNSKRRQQTPANSSTKPSIEFSVVAMPEGDHDKFKAAVLEAAKRSVTEFPQTLELVKEQFRLSDPLGIMASFATYGLMRGVIGNSVDHNLTPNNIQQYHAELLQAVLLTIPFEEWGTKPLVPNTMQTVFDTVPKLSDTFLHQRILAAQKITDEQENTISFLLERIRFNTQAVRNWGYLTDVKKLSSELYGPLDARFKAQCGFGISDLVQVTEALVAEFERRANEHFNTLQKVGRGENTRQMVNLYYRYVPDLVGTPEEFIAAMPADITQRGLLSRLKAHLNLRLSRCSLFKADEIAAQAGQAPELVETVLRKISLTPGQLVDVRPEHLFLSNPVWTAPGIDLGERFLFAMPQVAFSHIHPLVTRLGAVVGLEGELDRARSRFLEAKVCEALTIALPGATISTNLKWKLGQQQFETDCLAIIDRIVIIAEVKSNRLTPEGLRGAPSRVKRHIQELVLDPSIQSRRLEKLITDAKGGDEAAGNIVRDLGIDFLEVDRVIRVSVTLDDLSALHSAEAEFKKIGWIPDDHWLAPTISIADLMCIIDILDSPVHFLHYLNERAFIQKDISITGDEMDFLGLYLETGFNLSALEARSQDFLATGLSSQVDQYYDSRDAGVKQAKPKIKSRPLFRDIIARLSQKRPEGWTIAGLHLLNSGDYFEQQKMERSLAKLRRMVQKGHRNPEHVNSLQIQPLKSRKAQLVFYLYPEVLRANHKAAMERLAVEALQHSQSQECCVFGKCIDNWREPYEAVCVLRRNGDSTVPAD